MKTYLGEETVILEVSQKELDYMAEALISRVVARRDEGLDNMADYFYEMYEKVTNIKQVKWNQTK